MIGIMQYHPEFIDDDGKSRVRDIVLVAHIILIQVTLHQIVTFIQNQMVV